MGSEWATSTLGEAYPLLYGKGLRAVDRVRTGAVHVFGSNGSFDKHDRPLTSGPTVIVGRKGSVGEVHFSKFPCWVGDTAFYIEESEAHDIRFVYYLMKSLPLTDMNTDAAVPGLNRKNASRLPVPIPPIEEQRAIAEVLGALDDRIEWCAEAAVRLEGLLLHLARGDTATASVSELASYVNGGAYTKHATGEGRLIIRIAELSSGVGASSKYADIVAPPERTAYPGDILFSWSATLDVYRWTGDESLVNQHIFKVLPNDAFPDWLVYAKLKEAVPTFQKIAHDRATTMGHIKRGHLEQVHVRLPDEAHLERVCDLGDALWEQHLRVNREHQHLANLRDTLLPRLLSGELRVEDPGRLLGDVT